MRPVFLALGSNLDDREGYLRSGIRDLAANGVNMRRSASVYSTEPRDVVDQPWFLNTVVHGVTTLAPEDLLKLCLRIEADHHRTRGTSKGPRTLDIDIIFYGNEIIRRPGLTIPHPRFASRLFVLVPLAEIAPDFEDPVSGQRVQQLLESCTDTAKVTRVSGALTSSPPLPIEPQ